MNDIWITDLDTYLEICELALKHGKKAGDSMQEEFDEIRKKYQDKIKHLSQTEKDVDQITGDLRENGLRILNLNEEERKRKKKDNEKL